MRQLAHAMEYWSNGAMKAVFLKHEVCGFDEEPLSTRTVGPLASAVRDGVVRASLFSNIPCVSGIFWCGRLPYEFDAAQRS